MSVGLTSYFPPLAKPRSCLVRSAALFTQSSIPFRCLKSWWEESLSISIKEVRPWIPMSRLLKSWATPPPKVPRASILCACWSWASSCCFPFSACLHSLISRATHNTVGSPWNSNILGLILTGISLPSLVMCIDSKSEDFPLRSFLIIEGRRSWSLGLIISKGVNFNNSSLV